MESSENRRRGEKPKRTKPLDTMEVLAAISITTIVSAVLMP